MVSLYIDTTFFSIEANGSIGEVLGEHSLSHRVNLYHAKEVEIADPY